ncbi:hypothetical protein FLONG3_5793 [Fusarium longipes]|uniref:DNA repair rad5 n=1 Tax=Fusarium longipes TaxID=694270 RepID=A0A395SSL7_9HYPO|nr:hypothetical protein FLONG3_5793 [Fusarium longipes]
METSSEPTGHQSSPTADKIPPTDGSLIKKEQNHTPQVKREDTDSTAVDMGKSHQLEPQATVIEFQNNISLDVDSEGEDNTEEDINSRDDGDFIPGDDSDTDTSDDDEDGDEQGSKAQLTAIEEASKELETLQREYGKLSIKKISGSELVDEECQRMKELEARITKIQGIKENLNSDQEPSKPKAKRFVAKTARAYWEHQQEKQAEKDEKKRKLDESPDGPNKSRKINDRGHPGGIMSTFETSKIGNSDDSAPVMKEITASTHAANFKQIMAGIPKEYDTRRTATQVKDVKSAPKSFGFRKVSAKDGKWLLKGMSTSLLNYQIVAASWMIMREAKGLHPSGGLLADDMGLGKTITCITTIIGHPPEKEDVKEFCKTTLIIADSPQAAKQWYSQIEEHGSTNSRQSLDDWTEIYRRKPDIEEDPEGKTIKKRRTRAWWECRKVVIATYRDILAQFPKKSEYKTLKGQWAGDDVGFTGALRGKLGPIFRTKWYRIILDEGHAIKNHESSTTRACWELRAKYRWVVSGTPLSNEILEFYPYLRFIGCQFACDRKTFRTHYEKSDQAVQNFEALVSMIMYRRKQDDKFLGCNLVTLPKAHTHDLWVPLSTWECVLNTVVNDKYETDLSNKQNEGEHKEKEDGDNGQLSGDVKDKSGAKEEPAEEDGDAKMEEEEADTKTAFGIRLAQCIRLRQISSHPFNFEQFLREDDREQEIRSTLDKLRTEVSQLTTTADRANLNEAISSKYLRGLETLEERTSDMFGDSEDIIKMVELVNNEHRLLDVTCKLCNQENPPEDATQSANCDHIYCGKCLLGNLQFYTVMKSNTRLTRAKPNKCHHDDCKAELGVGSPVKTLSCIEKAVKDLKGFKEPGEDSIGTRWSGDKLHHTSFFHATCGRLDINYDPAKMPLGAKVKSTASVILTWQYEAPEDRIIVFIEYTRTAKALGCVFEALGLNFVYYNQMATNKKKNLALDKFRNDPKCKVLVTSMKCGGQSLNLQVANRAIIVDIWWNKTVEDQAFKRIYRLGQTKETYLVRILARGGIDERVAKLQEAKEIVVASALQDDKHKPHFSKAMQLEMLFSTKDSQSLVHDMRREMEERKIQQRLG